MSNLIKKKISLFLIILFLSACANNNNINTSVYDDNDPLELYNRVMFEINDIVDTFVLVPVAKGYRVVTPMGFRVAMRNFFDNLEEPLNAVNSTLQGNFSGAKDNVFRFIVNSTAGIAGFDDVATDFGLLPNDQDFGMTLAVWGVDEGPYIVMPLLGGYNLRDAFGIAGDILIGPFTWLLWDVSNTWLYLTIPEIIVIREKYIDIADNIKENSIDYYSGMRETLRQSRRAQVNKTLGIKPSANQYDFDFEEYEED